MTNSSPFLEPSSISTISEGSENGPFLGTALGGCIKLHEGSVRSWVKQSYNLPPESYKVDSNSNLGFGFRFNLTVTLDSKVRIQDSNPNLRFRSTPTLGSIVQVNLNLRAKSDQSLTSKLEIKLLTTQSLIF